MHASLTASLLPHVFTHGFNYCSAPYFHFFTASLLHFFTASLLLCSNVYKISEIQWLWLEGKIFSGALASSTF
jgi:hypothetical protein